MYFFVIGVIVHIHEDNLYDNECYSRFIRDAKRCAVCYKLVTEGRERFVEYQGATYHADCFVCHTCRKSLSGIKFHLAMVAGEARRVCDDCHWISWRYYMLCAWKTFRIRIEMSMDFNLIVVVIVLMPHEQFLFWIYLCDL